KNKPFMRSFRNLADKIVSQGRKLRMAQLVLKLTVPGKPDIYQGDELELLSLADPDNRRKVDWGLRKHMLTQLLSGGKPTARTAKMFTIWQVMQLRLSHSEAFMTKYRPISAPDGVVAFNRGRDVQVWVAVQPGVELKGPGAGWRNVLSPVAD